MKQIQSQKEAEVRTGSSVFYVKASPETERKEKDSEADTALLIDFSEDMVGDCKINSQDSYEGKSQPLLDMSLPSFVSPASLQQMPRPLCPEPSSGALTESTQRVAQAKDVESLFSSASMKTLQNPYEPIKQAPVTKCQEFQAMRPVVKKTNPFETTGTDLRATNVCNTKSAKESDTRTIPPHYGPADADKMPFTRPHLYDPVASGPARDQIPIKRFDPLPTPRHHCDPVSSELKNFYDDVPNEGNNQHPKSKQENWVHFYDEVPFETVEKEQNMQVPAMVSPLQNVTLKPVQAVHRYSPVPDEDLMKTNTGTAQKKTTTINATFTLQKTSSTPACSTQYPMYDDVALPDTTVSPKSKQYATVSKIVSQHHDYTKSSDKAPLIRNTHSEITECSNARNSDDHLMVLNYPQKDQYKSGALQSPACSQQGTVEEKTYHKPDLPPRTPASHQPPVCKKKSRHNFDRKERKSDPLPSDMILNHDWKTSARKQEESSSCPLVFPDSKDIKPPLPPRKQAAEAFDVVGSHQKNAHQTQDMKSEGKSKILPIMKDGVKLSNTHYFLLPPKPSDIFQASPPSPKIFSNNPPVSPAPSGMKSPTTAHIRPIMRDGRQMSYTHYVVTPGRKTVFTDALDITYSSSRYRNGNADLPLFDSNISSKRQTRQISSRKKDSGLPNALDLSSLCPILPQTSSKPQSFSRQFSVPLTESTADLDLMASETKSSATQKIHRVQSHVHGVTMDECRNVLIGNAWNVDNAVHELKIEQLFQLGNVTRDRCESLLSSLDWNLQLASSVVLDESVQP